MKIRTYEQITNACQATSIIFSDLFSCMPDNTPQGLIRLVIKESRTYEKRVSLVTDENNNVYTGFLERYAKKGQTIYGDGENGENIQNTLRLSFVLSSDQSTKPLDKKVKGYGFIPKE